MHAEQTFVYDSLHGKNFCQFYTKEMLELFVCTANSTVKCTLNACATSFQCRYHFSCYLLSKIVIVAQQCRIMSEQGACICVAARWLVPLPSAPNSMHVAQPLARALCPVLAVLEHWVLQLTIQESLSVQSQSCHSGLTTCSQSLPVSTRSQFLVQGKQLACDKRVTCKCYLRPWCSCPSQPHVSSRAVGGIVSAVFLVVKGKYTSELVPRRLSQNSVED